MWLASTAQSAQPLATAAASLSRLASHHNAPQDPLNEGVLACVLAGPRQGLMVTLCGPSLRPCGRRWLSCLHRANRQQHSVTLPNALCTSASQVSLATAKAPAVVWGELHQCLPDEVPVQDQSMLWSSDANSFFQLVQDWPALVSPTDGCLLPGLLVRSCLHRPTKPYPGLSLCQKSA